MWQRHTLQGYCTFVVIDRIKLCVKVFWEEDTSSTHFLLHFWSSKKVHNTTDGMLQSKSYVNICCPLNSQHARDSLWPWVTYDFCKVNNNRKTPFWIFISTHSIFWWPCNYAFGENADFMTDQSPNTCSKNKNTN